jgi:hypothetical protein
MSHLLWPYQIVRALTFFRLSFFLWSLLLFSTIVFTDATKARSVDKTEMAALTAIVVEFEKAITSNDLGGAMKVMPPRVWDYLKKASNLDDAQMMKALTDVMAETYSKVKMESFLMDMSGAIAKELPDGTPYMLIPTETIVSAGEGGKFAMRSHTLALMDEGKWYLLRISDPQPLVILMKVYPQYKGVSFPSGSNEMLEE